MIDIVANLYEYDFQHSQKEMFCLLKCCVYSLYMYYDIRNVIRRIQFT